MPTERCARRRADAAADLDRVHLARIDAAIQGAIAKRRLPGAAFHPGRGGAIHERADGRFTYAATPRVTTATLFDAASLSKVLATAPSILLLAQDGKLDLDAMLVDYVAECTGGGKDAITIRHCCPMPRAWPPGCPRNPPGAATPRPNALACRQAVTDAPGSFFRYSDINFILLGQRVRRLFGMALDAFARQCLFTLLRMTDTVTCRSAACALAPSRPRTRGRPAKSTTRPCAASAGWPVRPACSAPWAMSPASRSLSVLLWNRAYPDDKADVLALYSGPGTLSARAAGLVRGAP